MPKRAPSHKTLTGSGVSSGVAIGPAFVIAHDVLTVPRRTLEAGEIEAERARLAKAVETALKDLSHLAEKSHDLPKAAGEDVRLLIEAHKGMLEGRLTRGADSRIARQKINAEAALEAEIASIAAGFAAIGDAYIAARVEDVKSVGARLMRLMLQSDGRSLADVPKGSIILAEDISPADAALLDPGRVQAFATQLGGAEGHAAIMARALNLPAVMGLTNLLSEVQDGMMVIVDGRQGELIINPSAAVVRKYEKLREGIREKRRDLKRIKLLPAVTKDGTVISLGANLEIPLEVAAARAAGAESVGLLRTEFMFMNRTTLPDEEQQYNMLRHVVEGMEGRVVTIRTLDVGGEKIAAALAHRFAHSPNPALGLRAIRLSLREESLLLTQFMAILRASAHGPVRIMLPMITAVQEVQRARRVLEIAARRLQRRHEKFDAQLPPVGSLIEVPAAALIAEELAKVSDFFAIGTNDLTQYTLAVDRGDDQVAHLYDPLHPAVLKLIAATVAAGRAAGIPVSVCGEMAGDTRHTALLLKMGIRELSMAPTHLPQVKKEVRDLSLKT